MQLLWHHNGELLGKERKNAKARRVPETPSTELLPVKCPIGLAWPGLAVSWAQRDSQT